MELKKLIKLQNAIIRAHQKIKDVENSNDNQTKELQNEINVLTKTLEQLNNELNSYTKKEEVDKQNIELEGLRMTLNELNESIDRRISTIQLKHGKDGINGKDGKDGKDGKQGKDGRDGKDGLNGRDGKDGCNGLSAYEIAVKQGYEGTEKEWIDHITNNGGKNYSGQIAAIRGTLNELESRISEEEDPTVPDHVKEITEEDIEKWNNAASDTKEIPETLYALGADYAEYFEWEDGNPDNEDRTSLFVSIVYGTRKIRKAMEGEDILGITSIDASVIGNARYKDEKAYSAVGMTGVMKVKDNGICKVGDYVIPTDNGLAMPSSNDAGYKVTARYSEDLIEVLMAHDAEMISRIKDEVDKKADSSNVPTKTSELENDSGYITNDIETDFNIDGQLYLNTVKSGVSDAAASRIVFGTPDKIYSYLSSNTSGAFAFSRGKGNITVYPNTTNYNCLMSDCNSDLGRSDRHWKDLYLSGALKDGTNSISISDIATKGYVDEVIGDLETLLGGI